VGLVVGLVRVRHLLPSSPQARERELAGLVEQEAWVALADPVEPVALVE